MSSLKQLYSVETLDTRFASKTGQPLPNARPSKWNTPEYYFYYLCLLVIPCFMVKSVYDVSGPWHSSYSRYEHLLSKGWIPGRKFDNSDQQYKSFRDNIPYMAILILIHPLLRKGYERLRAARSSHNGLPAVTTADARQELRLEFDAGFAAMFLVALHGISSLKVLLILYMNYKVATVLPKKHVPIATWAFNIGILFANEMYSGYKVGYVVSWFQPRSYDAAGARIYWMNWGFELDAFSGLIPRWEVLFNITVLRLISFNFDYYWSHNDNFVNALEKKNLDPTNLTERDRINTPPPAAAFSFRNYFAYALYSPLYLTGPILTFNDFIAQTRHQLPSISTYRTTLYAVRFVVCLLTMEVVLHYLYAVAIGKSNPDWAVYSPFQLSMLGYFNLHVIWLKLLIPWRFFRLWALVDGIDPPENMVRCMSDNYSTFAFWRSWHRSFNRWITRYIFIPLGGSKVGKIRAIGNVLAVFTFVALWHDINLHLLVWGWLITLFILPETIATLAFPAKNWQDRPEAYRMLCGIGAVGNIMMMMAANLVGFALGLDGLKGLVSGVVDSLGGRLFLLAVCGTLYVGAQFMFEWRESEKRRGIDMKC